MKKLSFKIDVYDWEVYLYQLEAKDSKKDVIKVLQKHNISVEENQSVVNGVEDGNYDGATTFSNKGLAVSVVLFDPFSNKNKKVEVYAHEKRHVEDDIIDTVNLEINGEASAYLAGCLAVHFLQLSEQVNKYIHGKNKKKR